MAQHIVDVTNRKIFAKNYLLTWKLFALTTEAVDLQMSEEDESVPGMRYTCDDETKVDARMKTNSATASTSRGGGGGVVVVPLFWVDLRKVKLIPLPRVRRGGDGGILRRKGWGNCAK